MVSAVVNYTERHLESDSFKTLDVKSSRHERDCHVWYAAQSGHKYQAKFIRHWIRSALELPLLHPLYLALCRSPASCS
jgi:hypothetical protein